MRASELRIGNLIQQGEITMISNSNVWIGDDLFLTDEIEPIPLTEEWLLKFKAKPIFKNTEFLYNRFRLIWKESYKYWYVVDRYNGNYLTKVEFVHEWQNFVYILNDEEL